MLHKIRLLDGKDITMAIKLAQHVSDSTHENDHTFDLLLSRPGDFIINVVVDQYFSDHKVIKFDVKAWQKLRRKIAKSRNYKSIDIHTGRNYSPF